MKFVVALAVLACIAGLIWAMVEGLRDGQKSRRSHSNARARRFASQPQDTSYWYGSDTPSSHASPGHHEAAADCSPSGDPGGFDAGGSCGDGGGADGGGGGGGSD